MALEAYMIVVILLIRPCAISVALKAPASFLANQLASAR
jgi:hypothetical protein